MNGKTSSTRQEFLQELDKQLKRKLGRTEAPRIMAFAQRFLAYLPMEEILQRRFADVYGAVLTGWQFLQRRLPQDAPIRAFNPALEEDGWQSTHTVIFMIHPNIPFLIDSLRMAINQRELNLHSVHYALLPVERDSQGQLQQLHTDEAAEAECDLEAFIVLEVDRHSDPKDLQELQDVLASVLTEVRSAVEDFPHMREKAQAVLTGTACAVDCPVDPVDFAESAAFLQWLCDDHFTFLGYDEYDLIDEGGTKVLRQVSGSELGILRNHNERPQRLRLDDLPLRTRRQLTRADRILTFAKSGQRSRVHRPAYPDYIAVKKIDAQGAVVGEHRFLGLYTAHVYTERPDRIPLLRRKIAAIQQRSGFLRDDYAGKELDQILAVYPRDEVFQMDEEELFQTALNILYIQERRRIRLFMREDVYGQFVTCLAFVPRDIYNTELRLRMEQVICEALDAQDIEFTTFFSESALARTQFNVRVQPVEHRELPLEEVEARIVELAQSWRDGLEEALLEAHGEEQGNQLIRLYRHAFSTGYRDAFSPRRAAIDVDHMDRVRETGRLAMSFYRALEESESTLHFKLFNAGQQLPLSDVLPIFENLGFRVIGEHPFETIDSQGGMIWIHDFTLQAHAGQKVDIHRLRPIFEALFEKIWYGEAESDSFNRLVMAAYFDWRQIALLRAYARYMRQIRVTNSQHFMASTLVNHVPLARLLLDLFEERFNPDRYTTAEVCSAAQQRIEIEFNQGLDAVDNLSEDRILRLYLDLIRATVRTNAWQTDADGRLHPYISFKLRPSAIPDMPLPLPMFEIFVYSAQVEGVHLRGGKVARGGLRWSDRFEDYRTEILGLVKAQQVKNAVIVPVGAKGGFVAKQLPEGNDRDAIQRAGIEAYKTFIRGLLDLTDNFVDGQVVPPAQVVRHDEDDYYLVVAADKGTATFSDIANSLSAEYGFWLADAFASGGSQGYDHKKMGITARGAWVSVERHFREMGLNPQTTDFSVVGIGDMAGDVFGNGLLRSRHARLVAAFNHMHIFLDPSPDPERSYQERERLFNLPRSTWADYDATLISPGGGVFSRSAKSIPLSAEVRTLLGTRLERMPPNMLINHILRAEVDLLWIGGIGTYVKSSRETHADVGDKSNDALRVDGRDLRCKVVGEGGNLGFTQLGRIEYALTGGRLNTDFIDNAGGVDCSDHEVNMKILLNRLVANGDLTEKQRNQMLVEMTDDVAALVLGHNYRQTQAISLASAEAVPRLEEYRRLVQSLEAAGKLNRALEFLPDDDTFNERKQQRKGLTRPELALLVSYVKGDLKQVIAASNLPDDPALGGELARVFPVPLVERFGEALQAHQLRREIIATRVANDLVDHVGITFVDRLRQSTGASVSAVALAYLIARDVFNVDQHWCAIEQLDNRIPATLQVQMMNELARLVRRASRWLLRNRRSELNVRDHMTRFTRAVQEMVANLPDYLGQAARDEWQARHAELNEQGVPDALARVVAGAGYLYTALGIVEAQEATGMPLAQVARVYYALGERLELTWFARAISKLAPSGHWQALARESYREDLDWQQRSLTVGVLRQADNVEDLDGLLDGWMNQHASLVERWKQMLAEFRGIRDPEYAMFSVALRELLDLAQSTAHGIASVG